MTAPRASYSSSAPMDTEHIVGNVMLALRLHDIRFRAHLTLEGKELMEWAPLLKMEVARRSNEVLVPTATDVRKRIRIDPRLFATAHLLRELAAFEAGGTRALDKDGVLQQLVADVLSLKLALADWGELASANLLGSVEPLHDVFKQLEKADADWSVRVGDVAPVVVPSLYSKGSKPRESDGFETDQWLAYTNLLPDGVVCQTDRRSALGPDILFKLERSAHAFFQVKYRRGSDLDSLATIRDGISNILVPFSDQVHRRDDDKLAVLFFVSTQYTPELETLLKAAGGSMCLTPGMWEITEGSPPELLSLDLITKWDWKKDRDGDFYSHRESHLPAPRSNQILVPTGTELVIVSRQALTKWLAPGHEERTREEELLLSADRPEDLAAALSTFVRAPRSCSCGMQPACASSSTH
jgi:hypothetical protein